VKANVYFVSESLGKLFHPLELIEKPDDSTAGPILRSGGRAQQVHEACRDARGLFGICDFLLDSN
jgi:hypothetical protein